MAVLIPYLVLALLQILAVVAEEAVHILVQVEMVARVLLLSATIDRH